LDAKVALKEKLKKERLQVVCAAFYRPLRSSKATGQLDSVPPPLTISRNFVMIQK